MRRSQAHLAGTRTDVRHEVNFFASSGAKSPPLFTVFSVSYLETLIISRERIVIGMDLEGIGTDHNSLNDD
jgi:hypothetical protein